MAYRVVDMILCTVAGGLRRRTLDATASHTGAGGDNGGEPSPPMDPTEDFEPMLALDDAAVQARMAYLEAVQDGLAPFLRAVDPLCEYGVLAWSAKSRCVTSVKPANRDTRPRPATGGLERVRLRNGEAVFFCREHAAMACGAVDLTCREHLAPVSCPEMVTQRVWPSAQAPFVFKKPPTRKVRGRLEYILSANPLS
jgi:hypothetical protein